MDGRDLTTASSVIGCASDTLGNNQSLADINKKRGDSNMWKKTQRLKAKEKLGQFMSCDRNYNLVWKGKGNGMSLKNIWATMRPRKNKDDWMNMRPLFGYRQFQRLHTCYGGWEMGGCQLPIGSDRLRSRAASIAPACPLCNSEDESVAHIFF